MAVVSKPILLFEKKKQKEIRLQFHLERAPASPGKKVRLREKMKRVLSKSTA